MKKISVEVASVQHLRYVPEIIATIEESARARGTGIAKRDPGYVEKKMLEGKAIIALYEGRFAGFCYIETWSEKRFVANSGLIVREDLRGQGIAKMIKQAAFNLSRQRYPQAKMFGLTTGLAVMKINTELGYHPVTFSELTTDEDFWNGCRSCNNYDILQRTKQKHCLCTGMLFDPAWLDKDTPATPPRRRRHSFQVYERWFRFKSFSLSRQRKEKQQKKKEGLLLFMTANRKRS